jgi:pimeloyl-ACP methyl ester carboxylesterase
MIRTLNLQICHRTMLINDCYNASNAFVVAQQLAPMISAIPGEKVIMAHSLGNMVASSMIQDYGLQVSKYIMCNSAVPSEAYDSLLADYSPTNHLVHEDWVDYTNVCWTASWYRLFPENDTRSKLTWQGRFPNVVPVAINFYSSGDEVLEIYTDSQNPSLSDGLVLFDNKGRYSWHKQELWKGRKGILAFLGTTDWSGWGLNSSWTKESANQMACTDMSVFMTNTVFNPSPSSIMNSNASRLEIDAHLTQGIPALSPATGSINLFDFNIQSYDMDSFKSNIWPRGETHNFADRFLHSDISKIAYFFLYKIFNNIIDKGNLR